MKRLLALSLWLMITACEQMDLPSVDVRTAAPSVLSRINADSLRLIVRLSGDASEYIGASGSDGFWTVSLPIETGRSYQFTAYWYVNNDGNDLLVMEQTGQFFADPETMSARPVTTDQSEGQQQFDIDCDGMSNLQEINQDSDPMSDPGCATEPPPIDEQNSDGVPVTIRLPPRCFMMGSPDGEQGRRENEVLHETCVEAFSIGVYEVTFDEYEIFANSEGVLQEPPSVGARPKGRHPLIYVTFNDAVAYTKWLSEKTGRSYRLPTEVEWEYAARAGTTTAFWTGDMLSDMDENFRSDDAWGGGVYVNGPRGASLEVGSLRANQFGLYDMLGNVVEWTCTHYIENDNSAENICDTNTVDDPDKPYVVRGAHYAHIASWARAAQRHSIRNQYRDFQLGFRVVLED